jgi:hypothetical protein
MSVTHGILVLLLHKTQIMMVSIDVVDIRRSQEIMEKGENMLARSSFELVYGGKFQFWAIRSQALSTGRVFSWTNAMHQLISNFYSSSRETTAEWVGQYHAVSKINDVYNAR